MASIALQEPLLVKDVYNAAKQEGLEAVEFVTEAVRRHLAAYRQKCIVVETEAWYRLATEERRSYRGKFVAVYGGQVVDSDLDRLTLYLRIREHYGRQPILITEGGDQPIPVYRIRSPRRGDANVKRI